MRKTFLGLLLVFFFLATGQQTRNCWAAPLSIAPIEIASGSDGQQLNDQDLLATPIRWRCRQSGYNPADGRYRLGAFIHSRHSDSIRLRSWTDIVDNSPVQYNPGVAVSVVPYIEDIQTGGRFVLVPDGSQGFGHYYLACSAVDDLASQTHPNWYPSLLLVPETSAQQKLLKEMLWDLDDLEIAPADGCRTGPAEFCLKIKTSSTEGQLDATEVFNRSGQKIATMGQLVQLILAGDHFPFLDGWKSGAISIFPDGGGLQSGFAYHPGQRTRKRLSTPVRVEVRLPAGFSKLGQLASLSDGMRLENCTGFKPSSQNPLVFETQWKGKGAVSTLTLPGFEPLKVQPVLAGARALIQPSASELFTYLHLALDVDAGLSYRVKDTVFQPGQKKSIRLPLTQFDVPIEVTSEDPAFSRCNFSGNFDLQWALQGTEVNLKPPCIKNVLTWTQTLAIPEIEDPESYETIFTRDSGRLEILRHRSQDLNLTWGKSWNTIQLDAETLNRRAHYALTDADFDPQMITVEVILPELFSALDADLSAAIDVEGCDTFRRSSFDPLTYVSQSRRDMSRHRVHLAGFDPIITAPRMSSSKASLQLEPDMLRAKLRLSLPAEAGIDYHFEGIDLVPGRTTGLTVPLLRLSRPLQLTTGGRDYQGCRVERLVTLAEVLAEKTIRVDSPCRRNILRWPAERPTAKVEDPASIEAVLKRKAGRLEVLRRQEKDITLTWGPAWKSIRINARALNAHRTVNIGPEALVPVYTPVELVLPPIFRDLPQDLADRIQVAPCEPFERSTEDPRVYRSRCRRGSKIKQIIIDGFDSIAAEPRKKGGRIRLRLGVEQMRAIMPVNLPADAGLDYRYGKVSIAPGERQKIRVPLSKIGRDLVFSSRKAAFGACSLTHRVTLAQALAGQLLELNPPCQRTVITWPSEHKLAKIVDPDSAVAILDRRPGHLEVLRPRDRSLTLSWGSAFHPISIGADTLNRKEPYRLSTASFIAQYMDVELVLPPVFRDVRLDLAGRIRVPPCEPFERSTDDPRVYRSRCRRGSTIEQVRISGFDPIAVEGRMEDGRIRLRLAAKQMQAILPVLLPANAGLDYQYGKVTIGPGEDRKIRMPLSQIGRDLEFASRNPKFGACSLIHRVTLNQILAGQTLELNPPCQRTVITWPSERKLAKIVDSGSTVAILDRRPGHLEVLRPRDRSLTLSWGSAWHPVSISAGALNRKSPYRLSAASFIAQYTDVELVLPSIFRDAPQDLAARIHVAPCEPFERSATDPRVYRSRCQRGSKIEQVHITGFDPMTVAGRMEDGRIRLRLAAKQMQAILPVVLPADAGLDYQYGKVVIGPGEDRKIQVPLSQIDRDLVFSSRNPEFGACSLTHRVTLGQILAGQILILDPPCQRKVVTWPPERKLAKIVDPGSTVAILDRRPGHLEVLRPRDRALALSWGSAWHPITISAGALAPKTPYDLSSDSFKAQYMDVELVLPPMFRDAPRDLSGRIRVAPGEPFQRWPADPRVYRSRCQRGSKIGRVIIAGFEPIAVSVDIRNGKARIQLPAEDLRSIITLVSPPDAAVTYTLNGLKLAPGDSVRMVLPIQDALRDLLLTTRNDEYSACNLSLRLSLQEILDEPTVSLNPVCRRNVITWPKDIAGPSIEDGSSYEAILKQVKGRLEVLRQRSQDLTLSWQDQWQPLHFSSAQLNARSSHVITSQQLVAGMIAVELFFPPMFDRLRRDLAPFIRIRGCDPFVRSDSDPLMYLSRCKRGQTLDQVRIAGFDPMALNLDTTADRVVIHLPPDDFMARMEVMLAPEVGIAYQHAGTLLKPGEPRQISIPLDQIKRSVDWKPADPSIDICPIIQHIKLEEIIAGSTARLTSACRLITIVWSSKGPSPEVVDPGGATTIIEKKPGRLVLLRPVDASLTLTWGNVWKPLNFDAATLNASPRLEIDPDRLEPTTSLVELRLPAVSGQTYPDMSSRIHITGCDPFERLSLNSRVYQSRCAADARLTRVVLDGFGEIETTPNQQADKITVDLPAHRIVARLRLKFSSNNAIRYRYGGQPLPVNDVFRLDLPFDRIQQAIQFIPENLDYETCGISRVFSVAEALKDETIELKTPCRISRDKIVPYASNSKVILFPNQNECESADITAPDRPVYLYTAAGTENLKPRNGTTWAVIVKGDRRMTPCTECAIKKGRLVFSMTTVKFIGKRRLVVVANSKHLAEAGRGRAIQTAIIEWLGQLKSSNEFLPLSLFVVKGNKEVREILLGEDLKHLEFESQDDAADTIVGLISRHINFEGEGYQPLDNIATVGQMTSTEEISRILYFTDSYRLPEPIDDSHVGTLIGWHLDGVEVIVVTDSNADKWRFRDLVKPQMLNEYPDKQEILELLNRLVAP